MKSSTLTFIIIQLSCLGIFQNQGNAQIEFNKQKSEKISALFDSYQDQPGAAIGIYGNDQVLYQAGFGYANLENDIAASTQSVFETGSVAMHVTATAILLLETEGKLSLDDPIQKHLTEFPTYSEGQVTVRHCFHHSSGMRDYLDLLKISGKDLHIDFDNKGAADILQKQRELTIVPGSDYRYSHSNYMILALIVERVSGMSLNEFAQINIFAPLKMTNTFFYDDREKVIKNRALLYGKKDEEFRLQQNFKFNACGDGRLYSTIEDMMKWSENFENSKIGNESKFMEKLFTRGILNNGDTMSYALGLEHGDFRGYRLIAHNGWWGGATAMFLHFPEVNLFVVTMGNNVENSAISKCFQASAILLGDTKDVAEIASGTVSRSEIAPIKITDAQMQKVCGAYFSFDIGYSRKIYLKDKELFYHDGEHEDFKLLLVTKDEFVLMDGKNITKIRFNGEGNEKRMYIQYGERPPMELHFYNPIDDNGDSLIKFKGKYHSNELAIDYVVKIEDKKLKIYTDEKLLLEFNPLMTNIFNSAHDGYLNFEIGADGEVSRFTLNDYSLGSMSFSKL